MTLPHGALEQLLSPDGGVEAFDKAVADSKAQTQALLNREPAPGPTVAKNAYNQAKKDGKPDAATRDTVKSKEPAKEKGTVPPPGTFNTADMSDQDVIALAGIHVDNVPSQLEPDPGALAALGEYVLNEGISSRVTNDLVNWWTDVVVETIGRDDVDYDELEAKFNTDWKRKLTDAQRSALAKWMRGLLDGGGGVRDEQQA